jgi:NitT/TauT family transport system substrate-binding protein
MIRRRALTGAHVSRREFLRGGALAGAAGLVGLRAELALAEPPPETTKLRLGRSPGICFAPQFVAEELLRSEGFTEIEYVKTATTVERRDMLAAGRIDITMELATTLVMEIEAGRPFVVLAGIHVGCYELFAADRVRSVRDLKGKTVPVQGMGASEHIFLASVLTYVGLDPLRDVNWVTHPAAESMRLFTEGKVDAFMGFAPEPQELRAKGVGRVILNTALDRPWLQYFCCMACANRDFVRSHPVATKRALRALLKAVDVCALEPERAARSIVDKGWTPRYDTALQVMKEIPYGKWREYDPDNTLRFLALRLHEAGMIKSSPQKLIAQGTDWRFLNELKKELKS